MSEKYYGNYVGIVISEPSLDPEGRNRVQVWVPSITNTLYKGWNDTQTDKNRNKLSKGMIDRLKNSLPWAECASPLIGGGAPFFSNSATGSYDPVPQNVVDEDEPLPDEESLPQLRDPNATVQETEDGLLWSDNGDPLDRFERESYLSAKEQSLLNGNDDVNATLDGSAAAQEATIIRLEESKKLLEEWNVPTSAPALDIDGEVKTPAQTQPEVVSGAISQNGELNLYNIKSSSVIGRANWGSTDRGSYNWFKGMIVHDDGSGGVSTLDGLVSWANQSGLGYSAGIKPNGEWVQFVPLNQQTNHAGSGQIPGAGNSGTIGVILIGVDERVGKLPTQQQYETLAAAAAALKIQSIGGHGEYTTRKVAGEGLLGAQYVRNTLGIGDLTTIADGSLVDRGTGTGESLPETDVASRPSLENEVLANSAAPYGGAGTATGTFSTISYLAKVWVFFYGGDIQKPIYFAQVTNKSSMGEVNQNGV